MLADEFFLELGREGGSWRRLGTARHRVEGRTVWVRNWKTAGSEPGGCVRECVEDSGCAKGVLPKRVGV